MSRFNHYIRKHEDGDVVPRGWSLVTMPDQGTFQVDSHLAVQLRKLLASNRVQEARTLFFWFDTTNVADKDNVQ